MKSHKFLFVILLILVSISFSDYCRLLIVCHENYIDHIGDFVQWKYQTGWKPMVCEIPNDLEYAEIKDIITEYVSELDTIPEYMLIIGDRLQITYPNYIHARTEIFYTDLDLDSVPDFPVARFPCSDTLDLFNLINKTKRYVNNPSNVLEDYSWLRKALCAWTTYTLDSFMFDIASTLRDEYDYERVSNYGSFGPIDYSLAETIDNGYGYVIYRGDGIEGWWSFRDFKPDSLVNHHMTPIVSGTTCTTIFRFGPRWVNTKYGGIVYVGCSESDSGSPWVEGARSEMAKGFLYGFLDDMTFGEALENGRRYFYEYNDSSYDRHYCSLHLLGDPTIQARHTIPVPVTIEHPTNYVSGTNSFSISVNSEIDLEPIENALCCITLGDDVYEWGYTNEHGKVTFEYTCESSSSDSMSVSVMNNKILAYTKYIGSNDSIPIPYPTNIIFNDSETGNGNSLPNINEFASIDLNVQNLSSVASGEFDIRLYTESSIVEILDNHIHISGLGSVEELAPEDRFYIHILENAILDEEIEFDLVFSYDDTAYYYTYISTVKGIVSNISSFCINDTTPWGNNNASLDFLEPGMLEMDIDFITNDNEFENVVIKIIENENVVFPINTFRIYKIDRDTTIHIKANVYSNPEIVFDTSAKILLSISGYEIPDYEITYYDSLFIDVKSCSDATYNLENPHYNIISSEDYWLNAPEYEWFDIQDIGTRLDTLCDVSDGIINIDLPFDFTYYGVTYDNISVCTEGYISPGYTDEIESYPSDIPCPEYAFPVIAASWNNVRTFVSGDIYTYYDDENEKYFIQYESVRETLDERNTYQIVLLGEDHYPTITGDNEIYFYYESIIYCNKNIGIQNQTAEYGVKYCLGRDYGFNSDTLDDNSALRITTNSPERVPTTCVYAYDINISDVCDDGDYRFEEGESLIVDIRIRNYGNICAENIELRLIDLDLETVFDMSSLTLELDRLDPEETWHFDEKLSAIIRYTLIEKENANLGLVISSNDGEYENIQPIAIPVRFNLAIEESAPADYELTHTYPNPFNSNINFELPSAHSIIEIYSTNGKLLERHTPQAQSFTLDWHSSEYSTGVYLYKIITDNKEQSGKVVYIK